MAKRGIKKITARVVPSKSVAPNKENPCSGMDPRVRSEELRRILGRIWASICRREAEGSAEDSHHARDNDA